MKIEETIFKLPSPKGTDRGKAHTSAANDVAIFLSKRCQFIQMDEQTLQKVLADTFETLKTVPCGQHPRDVGGSRRT